MDDIPELSAINNETNKDPSQVRVPLQPIKNDKNVIKGVHTGAIDGVTLDGSDYNEQIDTGVANALDFKPVNMQQPAILNVMAQIRRDVTSNLSGYNSARNSSLKLIERIIAKPTKDTSASTVRNIASQIYAERLQNARLNDISSLTGQNTATLKNIDQFQTQIASRYMKQDLSLSYRELFGIKNLVSLTKAMADMIENKLEAIKINTSLPDVKKITLIDFLKGEAFNYVRHMDHGKIAGGIANFLKNDKAPEVIADKLKSANKTAEGFVRKTESFVRKSPLADKTLNAIDAKITKLSDAIAPKLQPLRDKYTVLDKEHKINERIKPEAIWQDHKAARESTAKFFDYIADKLKKTPKDNPLQNKIPDSSTTQNTQDASQDTTPRLRRPTTRPFVKPINPADILKPKDMQIIVGDRLDKIYTLLDKRMPQKIRANSYEDFENKQKARSTQQAKGDATSTSAGAGKSSILGGIAELLHHTGSGNGDGSPTVLGEVERVAEDTVLGSIGRRALRGVRGVGRGVYGVGRAAARLAFGSRAARTAAATAAAAATGTTAKVAADALNAAKAAENTATAATTAQKAGRLFQAGATVARGVGGGALTAASGIARGAGTALGGIYRGAIIANSGSGAIGTVTGIAKGSGVALGGVARGAGIATAGVARGGVAATRGVVSGTRAILGAGARAAEPVAAVAAEKASTTILGRILSLGSKSLGKKIPLIGAGVGGALAAERVWDGDYTGAGLEAASGLVSMIPWVGTVASIGIDLEIMHRDSQIAANDPTKGIPLELFNARLKYYGLPNASADLRKFVLELEEKYHVIRTSYSGGVKPTNFSRADFYKIIKILGFNNQDQAHRDYIRLWFDNRFRTNYALYTMALTRHHEKPREEGSITEPAKVAAILKDYTGYAARTVQVLTVKYQCPIDPTLAGYALYNEKRNKRLFPQDKTQEPTPQPPAPVLTVTPPPLAALPPQPLPSEQAGAITATKAGFVTPTPLSTPQGPIPFQAALASLAPTATPNTPSPTTNAPTYRSIVTGAGNASGMYVGLPSTNPIANVAGTGRLVFNPANQNTPAANRPGVTTTRPPTGQVMAGGPPRNAPGAPVNNRPATDLSTLPAGTSQGTLDVNGKQIPREVLEAAQKSQQKWGVPASVTLSQWALESGWGRHMPPGSNNPFGIKARAGQASVNAATQEQGSGGMVNTRAGFRKFDSIEQAFDEHARLLATGRPYANARAQQDPHAYAQALQGVYATDAQYGSKLHAMQDRYFAQFDNPATSPLATTPNTTLARATTPPSPTTVAAATSPAGSASPTPINVANNIPPQAPVNTPTYVDGVKQFPPVSTPGAPPANTNKINTVVANNNIAALTDASKTDDSLITNTVDKINPKHRNKTKNLLSAMSNVPEMLKSIMDPSASTPYVPHVAVASNASRIVVQPTNITGAPPTTSGSGSSAAPAQAAASDGGSSEPTSSQSSPSQAMPAFGGSSQPQSVPTRPSYSISRPPADDGGSSGSPANSNTPSSIRFPTGGGGSLFAQKAPTIMARLQQDFQLSPQQAAAIVGNLGHESGGFRHMQEISPIGGGRGGLGWAQWTGPRRVQFESWAAANHLDTHSDEANYGFLKHELQTTQRSAINAVKQTSDVSSATLAFERTFERANPRYLHMEARENYANQAMAGARAAGPTYAGTQPSTNAPTGAPVPANQNVASATPAGAPGSNPTQTPTTTQPNGPIATPASFTPPVTNTPTYDANGVKQFSPAGSPTSATPPQDPGGMLKSPAPGPSVTGAPSITGPTSQNTPPPQGSPVVGSPSSPGVSQGGPTASTNRQNADPVSGLPRGSVGSGQCVDLVKQTTGLGHTSTWQQGASVLGNPNIKPGTAIACFDPDGRYGNHMNGSSHAAIYLGPSTAKPGGIRVYDQWSGQPGHIRDIGPSGRTAVNSANAFSVIKTANQPEGVVAHSFENSSPANQNNPNATDGSSQPQGGAPGAGQPGPSGSPPPSQNSNFSQGGVSSSPGGSSGGDGSSGGEDGSGSSSQSDGGSNQQSNAPGGNTPPANNGFVQSNTSVPMMARSPLSRIIDAIGGGIKGGRGRNKTPFMNIANPILQSLETAQSQRGNPLGQLANAAQSLTQSALNPQSILNLPQEFMNHAKATSEGMMKSLGSLGGIHDTLKDLHTTMQDAHGPAGILSDISKNLVEGQGQQQSLFTPIINQLTQQGQDQKKKHDDADGLDVRKKREPRYAA